MGWAASAVAVSLSFGQTPHSGTYLLVRRLSQLHAQGKSTVFAKTESLNFSGRVFLTPHFAIHYTLAPNLDRPRFPAADSVSLLPRINAVLAALPLSLTTFQRDSALNASIPDSVVPLFVQRAGHYFELDWSYYADSLGMSMPTGGSFSQVFTGPSDGNRYTVDICNLETSQSDFSGPVYGVTSPSPIATMLENDFLYGAHVFADGSVTGQPIQAIVNGQILHDYTVDWDMGIKVTAIHEFSHGVHFGYTPNAVGGFHDWYELSATAMEEVMAPEVNDYFQYLPCLFQNPHKVPLINSDNGVCSFPPMFGQGIFHQYLTHALNKRFDATLWGTLRVNGNNLPSALKSTAQFYGANWDSLYSNYTAAFAAAGRPGSAASCKDSTAPIFLRDLPCWPIPSQLSAPSLSRSRYDTLPALTFELLSPPKASTVAHVDLSGMGDAVPQRVFRVGSGFSATVLVGNPVSIFASPDSSVLCLSVPNASFTQSERAQITTEPQGFAAFPNPANLSNGQIFFFLPAGSAVPILLTVVSESGRRVAELPLNADQASWTWNLKDKQNRSVPPGVYYYRVPGQAAQALSVLPR
jgi:hypothetical protein